MSVKTHVLLKILILRHFSVYSIPNLKSLQLKHGNGANCILDWNNLHMGTEQILCGQNKLHVKQKQFACRTKQITHGTKQFDMPKPP